MWKRLAIVWSALKSDLRLLWFAVMQPHSPAWLKLGLAAGVLYLFLPIDLIPDLLPAVGVMDDVVILTLLLRFLLARLPADIRAAAQQRADGSARAVKLRP